jgi:hypothetical protein
MSKNLRSKDTTYLGSVKYGHLDTFCVDSKGLRQRQAPTGVEVIGRVLKLTQADHQTKVEAYLHVAEEITEFWIYCLNIYPVNLTHIRSQVKSIYEGNRGYRLLKKGEARGGETWTRKVKAFNDKMMTGLDIRTFDPDRV